MADDPVCEFGGRQRVKGRPRRPHDRGFGVGVVSQRHAEPAGDQVRLRVAVGDRKYHGTQLRAVAGIVVSLLLAKRSANQGDRRMLILFCCLMAVANAVLFAVNRHYLTLITLGVLLSAIASVAMPQIFALARE